MTNTHTYCSEIIRWAESPVGTKVWYKYIGCIDWALITIAPQWLDVCHYIVDDKHAELRKLQIDEPDTKFESLYGFNKWSIGRPAWDLDYEYRVRVEPVYEYQYIYEQCKGTGVYELTEHRTDSELSSIYTKFEPSKRIRKC